MTLSRDGKIIHEASVCGKMCQGCLWSSRFRSSSFDDEVRSHDEKNGDIVHPVTTSFSTFCHIAVLFLTVNRSPRVAKIAQLVCDRAVGID